MSIIGLDIGTTTLSAVALDESTHAVLRRLTLPNDSFLSGREWEKIQDPARILTKSQKMLEQLKTSCGPVRAIGLTGQMHGILYADHLGRAVSPLYTWQDGRGNLTGPDGRRFADALFEKTGYFLASGFGAVTHAWLLQNSGIPANAVRMSTIHAWLGMQLTGRSKPLLHASDAASLGLYRIEEGCYDSASIASLAPEYFPEVTKSACLLGHTPDGIPVLTAVGDNQASYLGSVNGEELTVLVNIGTGSQVSMHTDRYIACPGCETRPLDGDKCLLVGAPLCGGRAYALLEKFLRSCAALTGVSADSLYERMNALAMDAPANPLIVDTSFCGTRLNPDARGGIQNLGEDNFTPAHLIHGVLTGLSRELHDFYAQMTAASGTQAVRLIASGNAVRLNPALQKILSDLFGMPCALPSHEEEAATGAALLAAERLVNSR